MSLPNPLLRYIIAGQLKRNYTITTEGTAAIDVPGGSLLYAAVGAKIWDENIGLLGRVGEDYPQEWLAKLERLNFDRRGITIIPEALDLRNFNAYPDPDTRQTNNPVSHFARLGLSFPRALLDYSTPPPQLDSRTQLQPGSIRTIDIPPEYMDATAVHICPMDYLTNPLLPSSFRQGNVQNITLEPSD